MRWSVLGVLCVVLLLGGCGMSSGVKIDQDKIASLQKGKTTYDQAIQRFGKPTRSSIKSDGTRTITYKYSGFQMRGESFIPVIGGLIGGADSEQTNLVLTFNRAGILTDFESDQDGQGTATGLNAIHQDRKEVREVQ